MNQAKKSLGRLFIGGFLVFAIAPIFPTAAQITPDNTLGTERSRLDSNVLINNVLGDKINGGAIRDSNLFHSFSEFNINDGQRVYFSNPSGVLNILTRVTGGNASNILGTLGADGNANLFLINPNGILFGKNASLDVRGSFVGTTANGLQFGNQGVFSATNPQAPALLTVNPSALVFSQVQANAGIQNNAIAPAGKDPAGFDALGLRVPDGKSSLLVGGNVNLDGGQLNAYGGRVELGGLAEPGNVDLLFNGGNLSLKFPENVTRADVSLTNKAGIYVTGAGGGNLAINARNLEILQGSILSAGIGAGLGTPDTVAGDITLNATGEIQVADGSLIRNLVRKDSKGNGGNIFINSGSFKLQDDAQLQALTYGQGNAGNVSVTAKDTVSLTDSYSRINSFVGTGAVGNGGNIDINARTLSLTDGASMFSSVEAGGVGKAGNIDIDAASLSLQDGAQLVAVSRGQGNAGNITINAREKVSLDGSINNFGSGLFADVENTGIGKGGDIRIFTRSLSVTNAAAIVARTAGQGDAGTIEINASDSVNISGNNLATGYSSGLFTSTFTTSIGKGGDIAIDTNKLQISSGGLIDSRTRNNDKGGDITVKANFVELTNGGNLLTSTSGFGSAGKIKINANSQIFISGIDNTFNDRLSQIGEQPFIGVDATSGLFVLSTASGVAGNIEVESPKITLDDGGTLNAESSSGNGGNINVNSDVLLLQRGGQISTTAGTAQSGGDGGNINLNTKFIVAVPKENSDILANAFTGKGGNINIQTQGIFGIEPRSKPTDQSDITASSQLGIQGQVDINNPEIDPTKGIIELPNDVVDATTQLSQLCPTGYDAVRKPLSSFTIIGRGALPPSPLEPLSGTARIPLVTLDGEEKIERESRQGRQEIKSSPNSQVIEAQGLVKNSQGEIFLVAQAPQTTPSSQTKVSACP
jgi:filamentous hemagglutinin family protein